MATAVDLSKAAPTGRARVERLLAGMESKVGASFRRFLDGVRDSSTMERIAALLEAGDVQAALAITRAYVVQMSSFIPSVFAAVGDHEVEAMTLAMMRTGGPYTAVAFDPSYPRAAELIRAEKLSFITAFDGQQRDAVRQALDRSLLEGKGAIDTARAFRDAIGLTPGQEQAVANYRHLLVSNSREALSRDLRDRRSDGKLERAINEGVPLSDADIDRMVDGYRNRYLEYRAETITRTEATRATNLARQEAVAQQIAATQMPPERIRRRWQSVSDGRTRDAHAEMDEQTVAYDEPFTDGDGNQLMFPGDPSAPPATTINCRCSVLLDILPDKASTPDK